MRAILATLGILVGAPILLFFWIGTQTFVRENERLLAIAITALTVGLLVLSLALIFTASVQRIQSVVLAITVFLLAVIYAAYRLGH